MSMFEQLFYGICIFVALPSITISLAILRDEKREEEERNVTKGRNH